MRIAFRIENIMKLPLPSAIASLVGGIGLWVFFADVAGYKSAALISFSTIIANIGFQSIRAIMGEKRPRSGRGDNVIQKR